MTASTTPSRREPRPYGATMERAGGRSLATDAGLSPPSGDVAARRVAELVELVDRLARTMGAARALIGAGRTLDLTGIDDGIGALCAQALDLPAAQGRAMLPYLLDLQAQSDRLTMALRDVRPDAA